MRVAIVSRIAAGALVALFSVAGHAQLHAGGQYNGTYASIGIKGYDPVSYFKAGKSMKGSDRYTAEYGGVTWHFSSAENRDAFKAAPANYAPQYGGFCSWGVAEKGRLFDVDPENGWTIHEGKLYLNFNADINRTFRSRPASYVSEANKKWPALNR